MGLQRVLTRALLSSFLTNGRSTAKFSPTAAFLHFNNQPTGGSEPDPVPPTNDEGQPLVLPPLMDFPRIMWPSFVNTLRNWFFIHFVIRPYMDKEFDLAEFDRGARQAVSLVSNKIVKGEFEELEGLVDDVVLLKLKNRMSTFSVFQRELLRVEPEDVFFSFMYQIGIIIPDIPESERAQLPQSRPHQAGWIEPMKKDDFPEYRPPQKRYLEITVVLHVLRGFAQRSRSGDMKTLQEFIQAEDTRNNVMVCNYRFFKDFTDGVKSPDWIINMVNQFLPADYVKK